MAIAFCAHSFRRVPGAAPQAGVVGCPYLETTGASFGAKRSRGHIWRGRYGLLCIDVTDYRHKKVLAGSFSSLPGLFFRGGGDGLHYKLENRV